MPERRELVRPDPNAFVDVPGGRFEMGMSEADIACAKRHIEWTSGLDEIVAIRAQVARPVREVVVEPFRCLRTLLRDAANQIVCLSRSEALALAKSWGMRLLSEAELEWIFRDGRAEAFALGANRAWDEGLEIEELVSSFGIEECHYNQWVADDWHPSYEGAPDRAVAWMDGDTGGVVRMGFRFDVPESGDELLLDALAATRHRGDFDCCIRLAKDL